MTAVVNLEASFFAEVLSRYGYDFSRYSPAMVGRQMARCMERRGISSVARFIAWLLNDPDLFKAFLGRLSIPVSTMFRDPQAFAALRKEVFPILATYPRIRIWSAGIAHGEEVFSLAILLHEAGLLSRSLIYATDFNPERVRNAKEGRFSLAQMAEFSRNYFAAGGEESLSRYYCTNATHAQMDPLFADRIVFSTHNLATDGPFNEFHLVVCRNVVIYFNRELTERALDLFHDSLDSRGFLWLGNRERLQSYERSKSFHPFASQGRIYRKI